MPGVFWTSYALSIYVVCSGGLFLHSMTRQKQHLLPRQRESLARKTQLSTISLMFLHWYGRLLACNSVFIWIIFTFRVRSLILILENFNVNIDKNFNSFVPNAPFLYPLVTSKNLVKSKNRKAFWCFQGVEKGCIGNKWVNMEVLWQTNDLEHGYIYVQ